MAPDAQTIFFFEGVGGGGGVGIIYQGRPPTPTAATSPPPPSALDRHKLLTHLQLPDIHICRKLLRQRLAEWGVCSGGRLGRGAKEEVAGRGLRLTSRVKTATEMSNRAREEKSEETFYPLFPLFCREKMTGSRPEGLCSEFCGSSEPTRQPPAPPHNSALPPRVCHQSRLRRRRRLHLNLTACWT